MFRIHCNKVQTLDKVKIKTRQMQGDVGVLYGINCKKVHTLDMVNMKMRQKAKGRQGDRWNQLH